MSLTEGRGAAGVTRTQSLSAVSLVAALALIEPALGRLEKLGDTLTAKQYLLIAPTGEIAYLFPALREIPISYLVGLSVPMLLLGLRPAWRRLREKGIDAVSALGWLLVVFGVSLLASEYRERGEWVLLGRIGVRYLALTLISVGAFLGCRDRHFLATLGMGGFSWDLSSAVFWAAVNRSFTATVPVPWRHHFEQSDGAGAPCWLVSLADLCAIAFFAWLAMSDADPLKLFDRPPPQGA